MPLLDALLRNAPIGGDGSADYDVRNDSDDASSARVTLKADDKAALHGTEIVLGRLTDDQGVRVIPGAGTQTIKAVATDGVTYKALTIDGQALSLKLSGVTKIGVNADGSVSMPDPTLTQTVHAADGALVAGRVNILDPGAATMTLPVASSVPGQGLIVLNLSGASAVVAGTGGDTVTGGAGSPDTIAAGNWVHYRASATAAIWYAVERGSGAASADPTPDTVALRTSEGSIKSVAPVAIGTAGKYLGLMGGGAALSGVVTPTKPTLISSGDTRVRLGEGGVELELDNDGNNGVVLRSFDGLGSPAYIGVDISAFILGDSVGNYSKTETPAAAYAILYGSDVTSVSDTITQRPSGVGASRTVLSGLGAAGSGPGTFRFGLPNGGDTLGTARVEAYTGDVISNASRPFAVVDEVGDVLTVQRSDATYADLDRASGSIGIGRLNNGGLVLGSSTNYFSRTSGATIVGASVGYLSIALTSGATFYESLGLLKHTNDAAGGNTPKTEKLIVATGLASGASVTVDIPALNSAGKEIAVLDFDLEAHNGDGSKTLVASTYKPFGGTAPSSQISKWVAGVYSSIQALTVNTVSNLGGTGLAFAIAASGTNYRLTITNNAGETVSINGIYTANRRHSA